MPALLLMGIKSVSGLPQGESAQTEELDPGCQPSAVPQKHTRANYGLRGDTTTYNANRALV